MASVYYKNKAILNYFLHQKYKNKKYLLASMHDIENRNILHIAVLTKDNDIIEILINFLKKAVVLSKLLHQTDNKGNTPLHLAAKTGKLDHLTDEFLNLHSNADLTMKNEMGRTAFHIASMVGNMKMIQALHDRDRMSEELTLVNQGDIDQNSALHLAALNKRSEAVTLLLQCGADPASLNSVGWNVLSSAAKVIIIYKN